MNYFDIFVFFNYILAIVSLCTIFNYVFMYYFGKLCNISFVIIKLYCLTMYYIMSHELTRFDLSCSRVDSKLEFLTRNWISNSDSTRLMSSRIESKLSSTRLMSSPNQNIQSRPPDEF